MRTLCFEKKKNSGFKNLQDSVPRENQTLLRESILVMTKLESRFIKNFLISKVEIVKALSIPPHHNVILKNLISVHSQSSENVFPY